MKGEECMKIEKVSCGTANVYIVYAKSGSILIDTGTEKYKEKVLACCKKANVKFIVLTHGHFDHCQNAAYLANKLHCKVGIGGEDVSLIKTNEKRKLFGKGIWGKAYTWVANHNVQKYDVNCMVPDVILKEGMRLSELGVDIDGHIIELKGHTQGSIGVVLSSGELFVGDAMQNITIPGTTWCYEDEQQAQDSVKRIKHTHAHTIYYGHGRASKQLVK